jgi:hypothetical protein
VRQSITDRQVHLVVENDSNDAQLLESGFTAQWNDDAHHAAHVLIAGETGGYYSDYAENPAAALARCLEQGFAFQGEASAYRDGAHRGSPSAHLSPLKFVFFLQNHDQIGNRAMGERLAAFADPSVLKIGVAMLLLSPQIPLLFMDEEQGGREPFLYFTSYEGELAEAVKNGRRREFGKFAEFSTPAAQQRIPDPNRPDTFQKSRPNFAANPFNGPIPTFEEVESTLCTVARTPTCLRRSLGTFASSYNEIPYSNQASAGLQRQIGRSMSFEADYVYTGLRAQNVSINANIAYDPATGVNYPFTRIDKRPYPDWGSVSSRVSIGESNYHALQMAFTKRFSDRWQANATYLLVAGAVGLLVFLNVVHQLTLFAATLAATSTLGQVTDLAEPAAGRPAEDHAVGSEEPAGQDAVPDQPR